MGWIRERLGWRRDSLELHVLVCCVAITEHQHQAAEQIAEIHSICSTQHDDQYADGVLRMCSFHPPFLIGTIDEIVEQLQARREQYGISYFTILEFPGFADTDAFSPGWRVWLEHDWRSSHGLLPQYRPQVRRDGDAAELAIDSRGRRRRTGRRLAAPIPP